MTRSEIEDGIDWARGVLGGPVSGAPIRLDIREAERRAEIRAEIEQEVAQAEQDIARAREIERGRAQFQRATRDARAVAARHCVA